MAGRAESGKGRNRNVDVFSAGAEGDADYQKTLKDLEEMQQRSGWLLGQGAYDKGDLLYLRDFTEATRHQEEELADNERQQFMSLRAHASEELDGLGAPPPPAAPGIEPGPRPPEATTAAPAAMASAGSRRAALGPGSRAGPQGSKSRMAPVLLPVRVRPAGAAAAEAAAAAAARGAASTGPGAAAGDSAVEPSSSSAAKRARMDASASGSSQAAAGPGAAAGAAQPVNSISRQVHGSDDEGGSGGGLAGLLGGYGSDSDSDSGGGAIVGAQTKSLAQGQGQGQGLGAGVLGGAAGKVESVAVGTVGPPVVAKVMLPSAAALLADL